MFSAILSVLLTASGGSGAQDKGDARSLFDAMESLQQAIEDFRCEFEGTLRFKGKEAENQKLGDDGLDDAFSGIFIWKQGGDTHSECLHRSGGTGQIMRESLVVRMRQRQAEQYRRLNDAPIGYAFIRTPEEANSWQYSSVGWIFLIDKIKREVADEGNETCVYDDQIDGQPLRVLKVALKQIPDSPYRLYWIDLRRNGHIVRTESYAPGKILQSRLDVKLAPFKVSGAEVWMPVAGEYVSYVYTAPNIPVVTKEPTVLGTIYVVSGTMEFNKRPGPDVFTIKYKPGTPISDTLRKLEYEFGQQKIGAKLTKADAQKMLEEQLGKAEEQKAELVAASPSESFDWTPWLAWGFGAAVLISSVASWIQRRRH